jgi:hypothetical protein
LGFGGEQVSSDEDKCLGPCQKLYLWLASTADDGDAKRSTRRQGETPNGSNEPEVRLRAGYGLEASSV